MSIEKQTSVDQITVTENGVILYRQATRIVEDGVELTKTYERTSLIPGQDLAGRPEQVVSVANAVWTEEVINKYKEAADAEIARQQAIVDALNTQVSE